MSAGSAGAIGGLGFTPVDRIGVALTGDPSSLIAACNTSVQYMQQTTATIQGLAAQINSVSMQPGGGMGGVLGAVQNPLQTSRMQAFAQSMQAFQAAGVRGTTAFNTSIGSQLAMIQQWHRGVATMPAGLTAAMQPMASGVGQTSGIISGSIGPAMRLFGVLGAIGTLRWAMGLHAEAERARATLDVLTGSPEAGGKLFKDIQAMAVKTAFSMQDLTKATQGFLAAGIGQNDILPTLQMLGDLSMGDTNKLGFLSKAYTDVMNKGKLQGQEIRQFSENGIGIVAALSDHLGVGKEKVIEMSEKGEISFETVRAALQKLTAEGGRFHGMLDRMSQTIGGRWAQFTEGLGVSVSRIMAATSGLWSALMLVPESLGQFAEVVATSAEASAAEISSNVSWLADEVAKLWGGGKEAAAEAERQAKAQADAAEATRLANTYQSQLVRTATQAAEAIEAQEKAAKAARDALEKITSGKGQDILDSQESQIESISKSLMSPEDKQTADLAALQEAHAKARKVVVEAKRAMDAEDKLIQDERDRREAARQGGKIVEGWDEVAVKQSEDRRSAANKRRLHALEQARTVEQQIAAYTANIATLQEVTARKEIQDRAKEEEKAAEADRKRGAGLIESLRSPQEKYEATVKDLKKLSDLGAFADSPQTFERAMSEAAKTLKKDLHEAAMEKARLDGVINVDLRLSGHESFMAGTAEAADALAAIRLQNQYGPLAAGADGAGGADVAGLLGQIIENTSQQFHLNIQNVSHV